MTFRVRPRVSQARNKVKATISRASWERAANGTAFLFLFRAEIVGPFRRHGASRAFARASVKFHRAICGVEGAAVTGTCSPRFAASRCPSPRLRITFNGAALSRFRSRLPPPPVYIAHVSTFLASSRSRILPAESVVTTIKGPPSSRGTLGTSDNGRLI